MARRPYAGWFNKVNTQEGIAYSTVIKPPGVPSYPPR